MIQQLQNVDIDEMAAKVGGRFKLCTMIIKRARMRLMSQDSTTGKLNSQVLKEVFNEIQQGHLVLVEPEETSPKSQKAPKG